MSETRLIYKRWISCCACFMLVAFFVFESFADPLNNDSKAKGNLEKDAKKPAQVPREQLLKMLSAQRFYTPEQVEADQRSYPKYVEKELHKKWANTGAFPEKIKSSLSVVTRLLIKNNGDLLKLEIVTPSSSKQFDEHVMRFIKEAFPVSPFPDSFRRFIPSVEMLLTFEAEKN